jgi:hypothetical protein
MKLLDRIALNRLISIITSFILSIMKIFANKNIDNVVPDVPDDKPFPWLRKKVKKVINYDK